MRITLNNDELKMLNKINISINLSKEYKENEIENILDEIYFNESTNVGYDNDIAKKYAMIADKIESQRG